MRDKLEKLAAKNRMIAKIVSFFEYVLLPYSKSASRKLNEVISKYVSADAKKNSSYMRKLKKDVLFSRLYYGIVPNQYFLFEFEKLSDVGRKEFVGDREKVRYTDDLHEVSDIYLLFRDKYRTYELFKKYYHREIIEIKKEHKEHFMAFVSRHPKFILKVSDAALGDGVEIYDLDKANESLECLFDRVSVSGRYIAEEFIVQSEEMMSLHPSSVNTVRFATYLKKNSVMQMFSFLRIGTGGCIIDNATAGGIAAAIDMETGIVTTPGWRENLTTYLKHPDTGIKIIGMQIPKWNELLKLVNELAYIVPEQKYVGWDLALTDDGWVMVEGNDSAMMTAIQMCEHKGLRKVFDKAFKEM